MLFVRGRKEGPYEIFANAVITLAGYEDLIHLWSFSTDGEKILIPITELSKSDVQKICKLLGGDIQDLPCVYADQLRLLAEV